jgi:TonB family protein
MLRILINHFLPFVLGFSVSVVTFYLVAPTNVPGPVDVPGPERYANSPSSYSSCRKDRERARSGPWYVTSQPQITSIPQPGYTEAALKNQTTGIVQLKVTLLASGEVGEISVVRPLPDGLTEKAIHAARQIKFEPKRKNGKAISTTRTVDFRFDMP